MVLSSMWLSGRSSNSDTFQLSLLVWVSFSRICCRKCDDTPQMEGGWELNFCKGWIYGRWCPCYFHCWAFLAMGNGCLNAGIMKYLCIRVMSLWVHHFIYMYIQVSPTYTLRAVLIHKSLFLSVL